MRCSEIMKTHAKFVTPDVPVQQAAKLMLQENVGFLPVCDARRNVLGTLTDRDIAMRLVAEARAPDTQVGDIYTREIVGCLPEDDVRRGEHLMALHQKSRLMCIDGEGRLQGVISLSDIAQRDPRGSTRTLRHITRREAHA